MLTVAFADMFTEADAIVRAALVAVSPGTVDVAVSLAIVVAVCGGVEVGDVATQTSALIVIPTEPQVVSANCKAASECQSRMLGETMLYGNVVSKSKFTHLSDLQHRSSV